MNRRKAHISPRITARVIVAALAALLWSCSATKHVPEGRMLLDNVQINIDNDSVDVRDLHYFLRQVPNHKVLGFLKLQLATYNLSGRDSTRLNQWIRSLGKPPVIYDQNLTDKSRLQLQQALINRGYMDAKVTVDTAARPGKKRISVTYDITTGEPYLISEMRYNIPDPAIAALVYTDTASFSIGAGALLDRNKLDQLRARIANKLRNNGYYTFNKDYITFTADTVSGSRDVSLTLNLRETPQPEERTAQRPYEPYVVRDVYFITDYNPQAPHGSAEAQDTVQYKGLYVVYGKDHYLKPQILHEKCYIIPGRQYSAADVERTYEALGQLGIVRYINIEFEKAAPGVLDAYIMMSRNSKQGVTIELEGTNSEGDLGFGAGATYTHRNLAKGSETLTAKLRAAYESLSGNVDGLINNRYTEYAGEVGITFPKFMFPLLSTAYKRRIRATTEFTLTGNFQERPEYTRIIMGAAWKYKWNLNRGASVNRHTVDLIDVNYVRLPKSTLHFLDSVAPTNPLLRYSYEDHFIMRLGYSFYRTNRRLPSPSSTTAITVQPSITTYRASVETAGNLLYAISALTHQRKSAAGAYRIFGIQYAQYVKAEADYSHTINFNERNALAFHIGAGVAVPYLNSSMVPFEKRFYAGGANSVRGWSVRSLGPGRYDSTNSVTDFINQCGDILLNLNLEYRAKLFWVLEGAAFIDAGNVWTIRDYQNQPGGVFEFRDFYKELAASYGVGLRLDFTYFLLRFDLGIKAHNPAYGQQEWPLLHPQWRRDATFHVAVGYPF